MENRDLLHSVELPLPEQVAPPPPPSTTALSSLTHATALSSLPHSTARSSLPHTTALSSLPHTTALSSLPHTTALSSLTHATALSSLPHSTALSSLPHTTALSSLLQELQIGESENECVRMKEELEQKCLDIYNKRIEETCKCKAELQRSLAEAEDEITSLMSSLGEQVLFTWTEGSLKHRISIVKPVLEDLRMKKDLQSKEFSGILTQTAEISSHIAGNDHPGNSGNLTEVQYLPDEKAARVQNVNSCISAVHELSKIMSFDPSDALSNVHESLTGSSKSISDDTLTRLTELVESWKKEKQRRLTQLQALVRTMCELWELLSTPMDERRRFAVDAPGCLSLNIVQEAIDEVKRLNALKKSCLSLNIVEQAKDALKESLMLDRIKAGVNTAQELLPGKQMLLPGEQLAPMVNRNLQGSSGGSDQEIAELELNLFMEQVRKEMEIMKEQLKEVGAKNALILLEDMMKLFATYYSLEEMDKYVVSTQGAAMAGAATRFFHTVLESKNVDDSGFACYERHCRQRRENEERRIIEEQTKHSEHVDDGPSTTGRK